MADDGYPRGLPPDELDASLATLQAMAAEAGCGAELVRTVPGARGRACTLLRVHRLAAAEAAHVDLRIAGAATLVSRQLVIAEQVILMCSSCACHTRACTLLLVHQPGAAHVHLRIAGAAPRTHAPPSRYAIC